MREELGDPVAGVPGGPQCFADRGLPDGTYLPATPLDLDAPLRADAPSANLLTEWYRIGDEALREIASELGDPTQKPILWPEHFDVGVTIDAINYGASPGDDTVDEPYIYVGPHAGPPRHDDFWNAPFGAYARSSDVSTVADAVAVFRQGRSLLSQPFRETWIPERYCRVRAAADICQRVGTGCAVARAVGCVAVRLLRLRALDDSLGIVEQTAVTPRSPPGRQDTKSRRGRSNP